MLKQSLRYLTIAAIYLSFASATIVQAETKPEIDWPSYLGKQDQVWTKLPNNWMESPFIGNGLMGSMLFLNEDNQLIIQIGRSDVQDHRAQANKARAGKILPDQSRLPIGHFVLKTEGNLTGCQLRLNLWDAEISGTLITDLGKIDLTVFIHSEENLLVVNTKATQAEASYTITWQPEEAFCPRIRSKRKRANNYLDSYLPNPLPTSDSLGDIQIGKQELLSGGETATAWHIDNVETNSKTLFASVAHSYPTTTAVAEAQTVVSQAKDQTVEALQQTHRVWWHDFYQKSFVSLPDAKLESFFWAQHYKMACASKGGKAIADNQGPWLQETSWPALWWNLNVQLAYSHLLPANHPELSIGLINQLAKHQDNLTLNVPEAMRHDSMAINTISGQDLIAPVESPLKNSRSTLGNLPWAMHNAYLQYRYTMDEQLLREKIYPLLKKSINFYRHFLIEGDDQKLHLPVTYSPEYPRGNVADCNYDLSLLRWGCQTLLDSARVLEINDPLIPAWQDVLERLVDYPQDETGWMIGKGMPYATSHRHYSHLLMFYPLAMVDLDDQEERSLARKSLLHWQSFPKGLAGYSYSGSSSMFSLLGEGDNAEQRLQDFLNDKILVNTFYKEGVSNPVIETPPAAARSIEDMLIQSWGDTIRVFPAIPQKWPEIAFADLRTEGAFLISAVRKQGTTAFVKVESLAGQPCRLQTGIEGPLEVLGQSSDLVTQLDAGVVEFTLPAGETITFTTPAHRNDTTIKPVKKVFNAEWVWGKN